MEFQAFTEIVRLNSHVTVTEKIHGTNAQIVVFKYTFTDGYQHDPRFGIQAGSRTRIITPEDDNYGFARWVDENKEALISALGVGTHYGEWFGLGINAGYGLKEKRFALFNQQFAAQPLPDRVTTVPVLYEGPYTEGVVSEAMARLKSEGSRVAPGFDKPEGVVVRFSRNGAMFKVVFEAEETAWKSGPPREPSVQTDDPAVLALLQPMRLGKLLSRDQRLMLLYPQSLPDIASGYLHDLQKEDQLAQVPENVQKAMKKRVFSWIKEVLSQQGYKA
jgi:hypothetical protein